MSRTIAEVIDMSRRVLSAEFSVLRTTHPVSPFLGFDRFTMARPYFPPHPHAGFSAITWLFSDSPGAMLNRDSRGLKNRIAPGGLHWTFAGSGVVHEEVPETVGVPALGLQLFLDTPSANKLDAPHALSIAPDDVPEVAAPGARVRVVVGEHSGVVSPLVPPTPVRLLEIFLDAGGALDHELPSDWTALVHVETGGVSVGGVPLRDDQLAVLGDGGHVRITGREVASRVLLLASPPQREPRVSDGPFVMTTRDEVEAVYGRYQRGELGQVGGPW